MKVLVAEDDRVSRELLVGILVKAGYTVVEATDGMQALRALEEPGAPRLAVIDWLMPELDGVELCTRVRRKSRNGYVFLILLTSKSGRNDVVRGLEAGADDYLTKPYDPQELLSRLRAGVRILELESALEAKVLELKDALAHVKQLQGLLPVCMFCKRIRDEADIWHQLESYLMTHADIMVSHALCQECKEKHYAGTC